MSTASLTASCAKCHQPNASDRKFCASCGGALWDDCPQCHGVKLASERFCGHCGVDVVDFVANQVAHFDERLAEAQRLHAEARFLDARIVAGEVARVQDPRFESQVRHATRLLGEFTVEQKEREAAVERAVELARRLVDQHAYATALETLQDVPEPLRSADFQSVFSQANERRHESEQLLASIRSGLEQKQTVTLLPLVERFLALKPDHPQATSLAEQLAAQVFARATKSSETGDWTAALELLRSIPAFAVTDAMTQLREACEERTWLAHEVRHCSLLHPALPKLAERLVELCPGNEEFVAIRSQLKQRSTVAPTHTWQAVPNWRAVPQRSTLGLSVDWWGGLQRLTVADECKLPPSRPTMGRWGVALGLALQALGKAPLDVKLAEGPKASVFGRLASGFRRRAPLLAWGIDLSDSSLKAVRLRWDDATQTAVVDTCYLREPDVRSDESAETARESWSADALGEFAAAHELTGAKVAVNMSAQQCLTRFCQVPNVKGGKFDDLVRFEARQQFPLPLEDLAWTHVDLRSAAGTDDSAAQAPARVMLLAAKKTAVDSRLLRFTQAGIQPDVVQCDALALHNFLRFDAPRFEAGDESAEAKDGTFAVLDVGAASSTFVVSGPNFAWFRSFAIAGDDFTKALVRELKLVRRQAEQAKLQPFRVRKLSRVAAVWAPLLQQLRGECQRSLDQWKTLDPTSVPSRLLCTGGGTQTYGLVEALRRM